MTESDWLWSAATRLHTNIRAVQEKGHNGRGGGEGVMVAILVKEALKSKSLF